MTTREVKALGGGTTVGKRKRAFDTVDARAAKKASAKATVAGWVATKQKFSVRSHRPLPALAADSNICSTPMRATAV